MISKNHMFENLKLTLQEFFFNQPEAQDRDIAVDVRLFGTELLKKNCLL